jgi:hypothetical protein
LFARDLQGLSPLPVPEAGVGWKEEAKDDEKFRDYAEARLYPLRIIKDKDPAKILKRTVKAINFDLTKRG